MFPIKSLVPFGLAAAALLPSHGASAATTVEQEIQALVGQWEGDAQDGAKLTLTLAAGVGDEVATGSWKVDGGTLAGETDFSILKMDTVFFLVPDKNAFAAGKDAYALMHQPSGLRFVNLAHGADGSLQSDELEVGKAKANGTRTVKLVSGEKLCADTTSPAGKPCGQGVTESIVIHKVTP